MGARQLVRAAGDGAGLPLLLRTAELVRGGAGGAPGGARVRRALRPLLVREGQGAGADRARVRAARLLRGPRPRAGIGRLHLSSERQGRDRERRDRHAARRGGLPRGRGGGRPDEAVPLAETSRGRGDDGQRRHLRARRAGGDGSALARPPLGAHRREPRRRLVPVLHGAAHRRRAGRRSSPCASRSSASSAGSCTPRSSRWCRCTTASCWPAARSACVSPAITPSTACAPRRASGTGARTWGRPTPPTRRVSGSPSPSRRRRTSSAERRCAAGPRNPCRGGSST